MTNHPSRSKRMTWTQDGDQWVSTGTLGTYRITEWMIAGGSNFVVGVRRNIGGGNKGIGEFSSLSNAKAAAEQYDGYPTFYSTRLASERY